MANLRSFWDEKAGNKKYEDWPATGISVSGRTDELPLIDRIVRRRSEPWPISLVYMQPGLQLSTYCTV